MGKPVSPGLPGILQRQQQSRDPLTQPLSPDEIWHQTVQSQRGFQSSPSGAADKYRRQPATIPPSAAAGDRGSAVGKGYETFSGIQLLDKDGRRVAFGAGFFDGGGLENHAEAKIVRGLEKNGPATVPDGRLIVVVEQDCCPSCEARLKQYAQKVGLTEIEIHVPVRESLRQAGKIVTPKTAATTSFMNTGKPTTVRKLRSISIPHSSFPETPTGFRARTAVVGTIANLAAGVLLGIVQAKMKEEMLESLKKMPKPQIDRRNAASFFADPNTADAIRLIDLMSKNLKPFSKELDEHHVKTIAVSNLEIALLSISSLSVNERLEFLSGLQEQLNLYGDQLNIVFDNLEAAKNISAKAIESAEGAEKLANLLDRAIVADWLLKQGFGIHEIVDIYENLKNYASRVRRVFQEVDALHDQVAKLLQEQAQLSSQVNKLYWSISLSRIAEELKKQGIQP
jgi:hypothetical protein